MAELARPEGERQVRTRHGEIDGHPWCWREADGAEPPVLYVHGVPTGGFQWEPFLRVTGGLAPDMPGFGQTTKRADLPYDAPFQAARLEAFLADRGVDRVRLVVQDWGAGWGLVWAQDHPERVERLVILDGVPLFADYRWHRIARLWRARGLGEMAMGATVGPALKTLTRESNATKGPMPAAWLQQVRDGFDLGTQRAILKLYRSADPEQLGALGARLDRITCPALVLWGAQDPYIPSSFARRYGDALGGPAEVEVLEGVGHWGWYDDPGIVDRVATFLEGV